MDSAKNKTDFGNIDGMLGHAQGFEGQVTPARLPKRIAPVATDQVRGETAELLRRIEPEVRAARRAIFKCYDPPFASLARASKWIEKEAASQSARDTSRVFKAYDRAVRACAAVGRIVGHTCRPSIDAPFLPYRSVGRPSPAGEPSHYSEYVRFAPNSKLGRLKRAAAAIAYATGFGESDVVAYLLVGRGQEPWLSPWTFRIERRSVRLPSGSELTRLCVGFELHVQDVPWSDIRAIHQGLRNALDQTRRGLTLTAREHKLTKVLESRGGVPKRSGAGKAWELIAQRAGYPNGQAARVAYNRILGKQRRARKGQKT